MESCHTVHMEENALRKMSPLELTSSIGHAFTPSVLSLMQAYSTAFDCTTFARILGCLKSFELNSLEMLASRMGVGPVDPFRTME